jgi:uncharacterized membrane protein required for colicin V production
MVTITFFFYFLATMFAVIGAMRGWSRELLVTFSVIVAIFIINVVERYLPAIYNTFVQTGGVGQFWFRAIIIIVLVFFGYQTPYITRIAANRFVRERFQDSLLGLFLGALNGYLIVGTLWYFLHQAGYPFPDISPPAAGTEQGETALRLLESMPPTWLEPPIVYFAVALAFLFVIVVFI